MISGANFIRGSYAQLVRALRFVKRPGRRGSHISLRFAWIPTSRAATGMDRSVAATRPQ